MVSVYWFLHFFRYERFVKWLHLEFSLCRTLLFLYMWVKRRKRNGHNTGSTEVSEVGYLTGASHVPAFQSMTLEFLRIQEWFYWYLAKLKLQDSAVTWNIDKYVFCVQRLKSCCLHVLANTVLVMKYQLLTAASFHKCSMPEGKTCTYSCIDVNQLLCRGFIWLLLHRFHVDLRPFPIILRIDRELENHPAFRAAHPSNQPDCPPEATK